MKRKDWTLEELEKEKKRYTQQKELYEKEKEIHDIKASMRRWKPPTTTKVIMAFLFLNCSAVEIYSMVVMWQLMDLSALYSLITAVVTESISFAVYAAKRYNEKKQEELIKLERDKMMSETAESCEEEEAMG